MENLRNTVYRIRPPHKRHARTETWMLVEQGPPIEECAAIKEKQLGTTQRGADGAAANLFVYKKAPLPL